MVYERDFGTRENNSDRRRHPILTGVVGAVRAVVRGFMQWRRRHTAINALYALDDAMLKDIGLHRSQIVDAVYRAERRGIAGGRPNHEEAEAPAGAPETGNEHDSNGDTETEREAA